MSSRSRGRPSEAEDVVDGDRSNPLSILETPSSAAPERNEGGMVPGDRWGHGSD